MKNLTYPHKGISLIFCILLLVMQSCRVYHHESVEIQHAASSQKRVKIRTLDGEKLKFDRIDEKEGQFYGITEKRYEVVETPLSPEDFESIRLHNKTWSVIYGIGIGAVTAYVAAGVTLLALFFLAW